MTCLHIAASLNVVTLTDPRLRSIAFFLTMVLFSVGNTEAARLASSQGVGQVIINGVESDSSTKTDSSLPPGTVVTTGEDGKSIIELAPGIVVELQPNTQITIGETTDNYQVDQLGNPIPAVSITVTTGTVVAVPTEGGLATAVLMIVTPRGNVSVLEPGQTVVTVTGADPESSTVTVASPTGNDMVTTTQGERVPVGEGLAVILKPDGQSTVLALSDVPNGMQIIQAAQSAASNIGNLTNLTPPTPPPVIPPPAPDVPTILPVQPTPTPTPTPTPSPVSP